MENATFLAILLIASLCVALRIRNGYWHPFALCFLFPGLAGFAVLWALSIWLGYSQFSTGGMATLAAAVLTFAVLSGSGMRVTKARKTEPTSALSTRLVTTADIEASTLIPLDLSFSPNVAPRLMLAAAVGQIEMTVQSYASPLRVQVVKVRTAVVRTLNAQEVMQETTPEFYITGLEYPGKLVNVVSMLKINDLGATASVTLHIKERLAGRTLLPELLIGSFISRNPQDPSDPQGKAKTSLSGLVCVFLVGAIAGYLTGQAAAFIIGSFLALIAITLYANSLKTRKDLEIEELKEVARLNMVRIYDALDPTSLASNLPPQSGSQPPSSPVALSGAGGQSQPPPVPLSGNAALPQQPNRVI